MTSATDSQTGASTLSATPTPQQMVDAFHSAFGDNHSRAVHAKGVMARGVFEPSPEAVALSKASLFKGQSLPVLARFSNFTGIPTIPDNIGEASPRGLALRFSLADGTTVDVVNHSANGFPAATTAEFRELLLAIGASGAGATKPTALDQFLAGHPAAKTFLTTQKPPPQSYATLSYFGVNAFAFTNDEGAKAFVRYQFAPVGGEAFVAPEDLAAKGPDYLQSELPDRLAKGPISFEWYAQVAQEPDVIDDPSIAWPESRRLVKLGIIHLDRMVEDPVAADKATVFAPLDLPAGMEGADPMLDVRRGAYPISFQHRQ